ncbi:MAG: UDP-N-acetylglucosamine--N-acetylmuramyl-(pentapeptide) pyrophosphoryl-undecaprenol N-acetylglucosamine transferase [Spirochaetales bacterium]|nr:UDP-N-acetylglucosamine--N-acetylmuramyl-(pentapeptide) pyrophosphoryl-undecaprenol N-acetylglucosamine transferase [Spirochaetales bacterium]MCF7937318.1 UDP-N-acetylglucosamine--N-acetylmuramyl-(pentapeptide) pyrophosphoryl-undecaprenol N-acetylglucosamine transferase [Spirochaetales bacterium]
MKRLIAITGGGSGGHVFPGIAVAEALTTVDECRIVWIGSKNGIEREILSRWPYQYYPVSTGKVRRYLSVRNLLDLFRVALGVLQSRRLLKRLAPDALFSKGGYVSVPSVLAAGQLGIPVYAHESDMDPGLATRVALKRARRVFIPFCESREFYPDSIQERLEVTGNPVRSEIMEADSAAGRRYLGVSREEPILLVIGGSQGAEKMNMLVLEALPLLLPRWIVVHQTGKPIPVPSSIDTKRYISRPFWTSEFPSILAAADLVVSRSGAGALWEFAALGKASYLLPLSGSGTRGDQVRNAAFFRGQGAAAGPGLKDTDPGRSGTGDELPLELPPAKVFSDDLNTLAAEPERLRTMEEKASRLFRAGAAQRIAARILETAGV